MQKISWTKSVQVQREKDGEHQQERTEQQRVLDADCLFRGEIAAGFSPGPKQCSRQDYSRAHNA